MHSYILNNSAQNYITYTVQTVLKAFSDYSQLLRTHFRPLGETTVVDGELPGVSPLFYPDRNIHKYTITHLIRMKIMNSDIDIWLANSGFLDCSPKSTSTITNLFMCNIFALCTLFLMHTQECRKVFFKYYLKMPPASHAAFICC